MNTATPTALITGASSGIGKALADEFAKDGYHLVLAARSVDKLEALADVIRQQHGVSVTVIKADLESNAGAKDLHAAIKAKQITLTALVNNAGYGLFNEFKDSDLDATLAMMQLNMTALVTLSRLFLPDLISTRGKLMNVASTAAFQPGPYMAVYYATKAFVLSFSEAIAAELAPQGVTVSALCPGPTASGFQDKAAMQDSALVRGKRLPSSESVANAGYRALKRGQRVYIPGFMNWVMAQSVPLMPRRLTTFVVAQMSKPIKP